MHYMDQLLFAVLPYVATLTLLLVSIQRYLAQSFTFSSLSTQLLENKRHFWTMVPFHYGILFVFAGHIVAFLIPRSILLWNRAPLRLYFLEIVALIFGIVTVVGLIGLIVRRLTEPKVRSVTSVGDWILFGLLLVETVSGIGVAVYHPWGSSWFAASLSPYLWSLVKFNPDLNFVYAMPFLVKLHIVNAFLVVAAFPFTRLVHILVIPNPYIWRRPQVVRWYDGGVRSDGGDR